MKVLNVTFAICKVGKHKALFLFDNTQDALDYFGTDIHWKPDIIAEASSISISNFSIVKGIPLPIPTPTDDIIKIKTKVKTTPLVTLKTVVCTQFSRLNINFEYAMYVKDTKELPLYEYFQDQLNIRIEAELFLIEQLRTLLLEHRTPIKDTNGIHIRSIYKSLKDKYNSQLANSLCCYYFQSDIDFEDEEADRADAEESSDESEDSDFDESDADESDTD